MAPVSRLIARRVLDRKPVLFRNPLSLKSNGSHQHAAYFAGMGGPLFPLSVPGKNLLQLVFEAAVTRLCVNWHSPPWGRSLRLDAPSEAVGASTCVDGIFVRRHAGVRNFPAQGHGIARRIA